MTRRRLTAMLLPVLLAGCAAPSPMRTPGSDGLVIAFGDSYTEGHGATLDEAYPALLGEALGRPVLNKGITGETAGEALRRLDRDVIRNNPDLVLVEFGVNEAFRGQSVESCLANLETIVSRIRGETQASVILVGVHFWGFQENFDEGLRQLAQRHDAGLVPDVLHGIVSSRPDSDDGDPTLRADEYHPNARGYAIMAERILPEVQARLAQQNQVNP